MYNCQGPRIEKNPEGKKITYHIPTLDIQTSSLHYIVVEVHARTKIKIKENTKTSMEMTISVHQHGLCICNTG